MSSFTGNIFSESRDTMSRRSLAWRGAPSAQRLVVSVEGLFRLNSFAQTYTGVTGIRGPVAIGTRSFSSRDRAFLGRVAGVYISGDSVCAEAVRVWYERDLATWALPTRCPADPSSYDCSAPAPPACAAALGFRANRGCRLLPCQVCAEPRWRSRVGRAAAIVIAVAVADDPPRR